MLYGHSFQQYLLPLYSHLLRLSLSNTFLPITKPYDSEILGGGRDYGSGASPAIASGFPERTLAPLNQGLPVWLNTKSPGYEPGGTRRPPPISGALTWLPHPYRAVIASLWGEALVPPAIIWFELPAYLSVS